MTGPQEGDKNEHLEDAGGLGEAGAASQLTPTGLGVGRFQDGGADEKGYQGPKAPPDDSPNDGAADS